MSGTTAHLARLLSRPPASGRRLPPEDLVHLNPKHVMAARAFLSLLTSGEVLGRLRQAGSLSDMKALLLADAFFERAVDPRVRQQLSAMLRSADVGLDAIVRRLALAIAGDAWAATPDEASLPDVLYPLDAAAEELGIPIDELCSGIEQERIRAVLCLPLAEMERLRCR
jgi:hypothetical protein